MKNQTTTTSTEIIRLLTDYPELIIVFGADEITTSEAIATLALSKYSATIFQVGMNESGDCLHVWGF